VPLVSKPNTIGAAVVQPNRMGCISRILVAVCVYELAACSARWAAKGHLDQLHAVVHGQRADSLLDTCCSVLTFCWKRADNLLETR
jgi:hypothetical protein